MLLACTPRSAAAYRDTRRYAPLSRFATQPTARTLRACEGPSPKILRRLRETPPQTHAPTPTPARARAAAATRLIRIALYMCARENVKKQTQTQTQIQIHNDRRVADGGGGPATPAAPGRLPSEPRAAAMASVESVDAVFEH